MWVKKYGIGQKYVFLAKNKLSKVFFDINLHYSKFFCTFAAEYLPDGHVKGKGW